MLEEVEGRGRGWAAGIELAVEIGFEVGFEVGFELELGHPRAVAAMDGLDMGT